MKKRFDSSKTYAIALGGGGSKGAYEVGVWRALEEEGMQYNAVSGTSVGALNGALMTMRELDAAEQLWSHIRYSQVMDVDDGLMQRMFTGSISKTEMRPILRRVMGIVREKGIDVSPLRQLLMQYVDSAKILNSDVEFYVMTYSVSDKKEVEVDVKSLSEHRMREMLLASAYFPAFKNELLDGKRYADGGFGDVIPVSALLRHSHKDIIAIKLGEGLGVVKRVKPAPDVTIQYIEPTRKLGSLLDFSPEHSSYLIKLGYYDAKRFAYGLSGDFYYVDRTWTENEAYNILMRIIRDYLGLIGKAPSMRDVHEQILPRIAREYGVERGDYFDILLRYLERSGEALAVPEFDIVTDEQLLQLVDKAYYASTDAMAVMPKCLIKL